MLTELRRRLHERLDCDAADWLTRALDEPAHLEGNFAAAGRHCGRAAAHDARVLLLHAAAADPQTCALLYGHGTAAERRAVLDALPHLPVAERCLPLVEDALRTHDPRLIATALGPYGARHLPQPAWRQAVLKCLFTGVPLTAVHGLAERAAGDEEFARMLHGQARERTAAGRPVPEDLHRAARLAAAPRTSGPKEP
ncbi:EboA domain-containing protein [Streptomyces sp. 549]|uniref:EboA domain-containing protein n=1 Tax=Streptomyces sp. 549 TaxID=3049076 RepID=UPI0024C31609|nr:EboA domain-containing protein [Streptomyces sp. 549]MDK1472083.1 EboA domain-containing protein [Streptomyces sp. 549]